MPGARRESCGARAGDEPAEPWAEPWACLADHCEQQPRDPRISRWPRVRGSRGSRHQNSGLCNRAHCRDCRAPRHAVCSSSHQERAGDECQGGVKQAGAQGLRARARLAPRHVGICARHVLALLCLLLLPHKQGVHVCMNAWHCCSWLHVCSRLHVCTLGGWPLGGGAVDVKGPAGLQRWQSRTASDWEQEGPLRWGTDSLTDRPLQCRSGAAPERLSEESPQQHACCMHACMSRRRRRTCKCRRCSEACQGWGRHAGGAGSPRSMCQPESTTIQAGLGSCGCCGKPACESRHGVERAAERPQCWLLSLLQNSNSTLQISTQLEGGVPKLFFQAGWQEPPG